VSIAKSPADKASLSSVRSRACDGGAGCLVPSEKRNPGRLLMGASALTRLFAYAVGTAACEPAYVVWPENVRKARQAAVAGPSRVSTLATTRR
jgi:hypothetical protein